MAGWRATISPASAKQASWSAVRECGTVYDRAVTLAVDEPLLDYSTPTPYAIREAQAQAIAESERIVAAVLAVPAGQRTFENTLAPLDEIADRSAKTYG